MKSTAPSSSARMVVTELRSVKLLSMMMGQGVAAMIWRVASKPSMTGISTSMVMTSGRSSRAISTHICPVLASPTT